MDNQKQEKETHIFKTIQSASPEDLSHVMRSLSGDVVWLYGENYYIPSTDTYFMVEVDGNYYHGYEILIHKRTRREIEDSKRRIAEAAAHKQTDRFQPPACKKKPESSPKEYVWFTYRSGNTENKTKILSMLNQCGVVFSQISLTETHDIGDEDWYCGTFYSLDELIADKENKLLCEWNVYGAYAGKEIFVMFHGTNVFTGVNIRCEAKDEDTVMSLLNDFGQLFGSKNLVRSKK